MNFLAPLVVLIKQMKILLLFATAFLLSSCSLAGLMASFGADPNGEKRVTIGATFHQGKEGK